MRLIPIFGCTIVLIFLVVNSLDRNPIGRYLDANNDSNLGATNPERVLSDYQNAAQKFHNNLPLFYFSVGSSAEPDTLHRIAYYPQKEFALKLLMTCGDWPLVQSYFTRIDQGDRKLSLRSDTLQIVSKLRSMLFYWRSNVPIGSNALHNEAEFDDIIAIYDKIQTTKPTSSVFMPKFHWYGLESKFHIWVSQLGSHRSSIDGQLISGKIWRALRNTLLISCLALILALLMAILLGKFLGTTTKSSVKNWGERFLFLGFVVPSFWIGTMCILFLTNDSLHSVFNLFPSGGLSDESISGNYFQILWDRIHHLILPVFCLAYPSSFYFANHIKVGIEHFGDQLLFKALLAKGLTSKQSYSRHGLKIAIFPIISLVGSILPSLFGGALIVEVIFNIPGVGRLMYEGMIRRDWYLVLDVVVMMAIVILIAQLLVDLLYRKLDPRITIS